MARTAVLAAALVAALFPVLWKERKVLERSNDWKSLRISLARHVTSSEIDHDLFSS